MKNAVADRINGRTSHTLYKVQFIFVQVERGF